MNTWFIKLLDVVRSEWRVRVEERLPDLTPSEASEFAHTLEVIAEDCAYLSTYIAERAGATGCGEATHEEAAKEAVFPGHGGGNQGEAYHLPIYAAAYHTRLESYELQQQKGVFVLVCDEQPYYHDGDFNVHGTSVSIAKEVFGDVIEKEVSMVESMTKLLETHHVLIIRPQHTQNGRTKSITKRWQDLLKAAGGNPEHVLEVEATNAIIATIALYIGQFIAAMDQADLVDVLRGNGADGIDAAARATSSIVAFAGAALAVGNTNTELVPSDMDGAPRAR